MSSSSIEPQPKGKDHKSTDLLSSIVDNSPDSPYVVSVRDKERLIIPENKDPHKKASFLTGIFLSIFTLSIVGVLGLSNKPNIEFPKESRQVGAFIAGMFGFTAIEAFRKSFEGE